MLEALQLPTYSFKVKDEAGQHFIFDELRKKYLLLTPEEWVRQHMLHYLILVKGYSRALISMERGLQLHDRKKRSDILIFDRNGKPFLLVECKASSVKINQKVFDQAAQYNSVYRARYIVLSNGMQHYCCEMDYECGNYTFLEEIPTAN
jgi:hypothetical protein